MLKEQLIKVSWDPPCSRASIGNRTDTGIYQIYGNHIVFGPSSLLYIGKSDNFAARFAQHDAWLSFESDVQIRLGRLVDPIFGALEERDIWLGHVEALTIYWHSPPYNSKFIVSYGSCPPLRVQNHGDRGRLLPEYSSHWIRPRPTE